MVGSIRGTERIGKGREGFNRHVRVVFDSLEAKNVILRKAVELNGTELRAYYVAPDITPRQQLQDKALRAKFKQLREGGVESIKIKRGTIVKNLEGREEIIFRIGQS